MKTLNDEDLISCNFPIITTMETCQHCGTLLPASEPIHWQKATPSSFIYPYCQHCSELSFCSGCEEKIDKNKPHID
jgi:hypothetical protein